MTDIEARASTVLERLSQTRVRATYGAVGAYLGIPAQSVSRYLGSRRPLASWVVNAQTGSPTGYLDAEKHEALYATDRIIRTADELRKVLKN